MLHYVCVFVLCGVKSANYNTNFKHFLQFGACSHLCITKSLYWDHAVSIHHYNFRLLTTDNLRGHGKVYAATVVKNTHNTH